MSDNPFIRAARAGKRLDYHQLNDGSDEEADPADRTESLPKRPHLAPERSMVLPTIPDTIDDSSNPLILQRSKPESAWIWSAYRVTTLKSTWIPKGKSKAIDDRLIACAHCSWTTKDSLRHNTTSNMLHHSQSKHRITHESTISTPSKASLISSL